MKNLTIALGVSLFALSTHAENLVDIESPEFGDAVRAYIMENPQIIFEAADKYQAEQDAIASEQAAAKLGELEPMLLDETNAIVLGNPDAEITFVELVDYACGYCRKAHEAIDEILKANDDVKVVIRQFPILSQGSLEGSQVALAIRSTLGNDEAVRFHNSAYASDAPMNIENALNIAEDLGIDREAIETATGDPVVMADISLVGQAARDLGLQGTPAFILNGQIFPGYIPVENLQEIIDQTRQQNK